MKKVYLTKDELRFLSENNMLGSHCHNHIPLALYKDEIIRNELEKSYIFLKNSLNKFPLGVSYPYGGKSAVNDSVFSLAKSTGYKYGLTMERGINYYSNDLNPFALKRIDSNDIKSWI